MHRVVGLMSGTSLDGVDAAYIETDGDRQIQFGEASETPYTKAERDQLQRAVRAALAWQFQGDEPPEFKAAELVLNAAHIRAVREISRQVGSIDLVGFHGQTVLHRAPSSQAAGATRQIGDGQALAEALGIDVIYDFRSADVAAGGQGAPLATLYHQALFERDRLSGPIAVLNLGGVANVSWLGEGDPIAFDTGPASGLLDAWCEEKVGLSYDKDGRLAAKGQADRKALRALLAHPFFELPAPKSLDRWDFSLDPVRHLSPEDGAATLTAFTAQTVAQAIRTIGQPSRILVTGGGRNNPSMMEAIQSAAKTDTQPVEVVGWRGDVMEAQAFAWLAVRSLKGLPFSLPSTTGVPQPMTGGRIARTS